MFIYMIPYLQIYILLLQNKGRIIFISIQISLFSHPLLPFHFMHFCISFSELSSQGKVMAVLLLHVYQKERTSHLESQTCQLPSSIHKRLSQHYSFIHPLHPPQLLFVLAYALPKSFPFLRFPTPFSHWSLPNHLFFLSFFMYFLFISISEPWPHMVSPPVTQSLLLVGSLFVKPSY